MLKLDIDKALQFLDMLDPGGRHTIASEAPFGGRDGGPRWERGATFEPSERRRLIEDIKRRQALGWNVYYGVNRPCSEDQQIGSWGKCNVEDIIAIRALAFDIDSEVKRTPEVDNAILTFIDDTLIGVLRPPVVIDSGGGFQLIYPLTEIIPVKLHRPGVNQELNEEQKDHNEQVKINRFAITTLAKDFEKLLRRLIPSSLPIKIDNMSNVDRVMRLPWTVNYPKAEKIAKGQVEALARIIRDYQTKCDIFALRKAVPRGTEPPTPQVKRSAPYVPSPNSRLTPHDKAKACCEFLRERGLADTNEDYTLNVLLPLLGAVRNGELTLDEAKECFMVAVSGGERYGGPGRGPRLFERQWRSHLNARSTNPRTLGTLIWVCQQNGMPPLSVAALCDEDFERLRRELSELNQTISVDVEELFNVKG
jgi:hypothetical protein